MSRVPVLTPQVALELKKDMWDGMSYGDIQEKYKVSYQMAVGIKAGRNYEYIPWPDSSTGKMADMRVRQLSDARRFGFATNKSLNRAFEEEDRFGPNHPISILRREGTYEAINAEVLAKTGKTLEQLPWEAFNRAAGKLYDELKAEKHEAWLAAEHKKDARLEANPALAERYKRARASREARRLRKLPPPPPQLPQDQVDPDANQKLSWEEVVALSKAKVVEIAAAEEHEPSLRLAIQIVFKLLSPRQWEEDHTLRMIYSIKQKIERFWEAGEALVDPFSNQRS